MAAPTAIPVPAATRTVTEPYQDPRGKMRRTGNRPWLITVTIGHDIVRNVRRDDKAEVQRIHDELVDAGFKGI